jgi:hypothetical protein
MKTTRSFTLLALLMVFAVSCNNQKTTINGHDYVDLGLPSGTLWATCNVGAEVPEDYGDYFAWGETKTKDFYDWETYKYANGSYNMITKYCNNSLFGNNGFTDTLTILQTDDDAAAANWGNGWLTPSYEQWYELLQNTTNKWTVLNGIGGRLFTAKNGQTLFLPAAGNRWRKELTAGSCGFYSSRSRLRTNPLEAWGLVILSEELDYDEFCYVDCDYRRNGSSVRPVCSKK